MLKVSRLAGEGGHDQRRDGPGDRPLEPPPQIDIVIQHHPKRASILGRLKRRLPGARVVSDPDPSGVVYPWRTYRECLASIQPEASHLLVVQDDATPCEHLLDVLPRIAARYPATMVSLYCGHYPTACAINVHRAANQGQVYAALDTRSWTPVVALLWPRPDALRCPTVIADRPVQARADDAVVGEYVRRVGAQPVVTVPNLVNHLDDVPSLVGSRMRSPYRTSCCWIGTCDPRTVEW